MLTKFRPNRSQLKHWLLSPSVIEWLQRQPANGFSASDLSIVLNQLIDRLLMSQGDESVTTADQRFAFGINTATWKLWAISRCGSALIAPDYPVSLFDTIRTALDHQMTSNVSPQRQAKQQRRQQQQLSNWQQSQR